MTREDKSNYNRKVERSISKHKRLKSQKNKDSAIPDNDERSGDDKSDDLINNDRIFLKYEYLHIQKK